MTSRSYRVEVTRDGRWWMIHVPELDDDSGTCLGQARRYRDLVPEARALISLWADVAPSIVDIDLHVDVAGTDITPDAEAIAADRKTARTAEERAIERSTALAKKLHAAGVPLRDIGEVIGVSFQRVGQLLNGS